MRRRRDDTGYDELTKLGRDPGASVSVSVWGAQARLTRLQDGSAELTLTPPDGEPGIWPGSDRQVAERVFGEGGFEVVRNVRGKEIVFQGKLEPVEVDGSPSP